MTTSYSVSWLYWKWALKQVFFFFLTFCSIIASISGIIDHYCIKEKFLKNREKIRTNWEQYTLKIMKILRRASLGSNFTGSYKRRASLGSNFTGSYKKSISSVQSTTWYQLIWGWHSISTSLENIRKPDVKWSMGKKWVNLQSVLTCPKLATEALEQGVKYVQS